MRLWNYAQWTRIWFCFIIMNLEGLLLCEALKFTDFFFSILNHIGHPSGITWWDQKCLWVSSIWELRLWVKDRQWDLLQETGICHVTAGQNETDNGWISCSSVKMMIRPTIFPAKMLLLCSGLRKMGTEWEENKCYIQIYIKGTV